MASGAVGNEWGRVVSAFLAESVEKSIKIFFIKIRFHVDKCEGACYSNLADNFPGGQTQV